MPHQYVDLDVLRKNKVSPIILPKEAARLLFKTKSNFISSAQFHSEKKNNFFKLKSSKHQIKFSHSLVRSGLNQWHVIENKKKGSGGFGAVNESKLKITVEKTLKNYSAQLSEVNDVVKVLKPDSSTSQSELFYQAKQEAQKQHHHQVKVIGVVDAVDKVLIIVEDCGISLDNLLPFNPAWKYTFKHRFAIAASIATEKLLLQQKKVVHRDLKPGNICYKKLSEGNFQIIFIDFGLASDVNSIENYEISGTVFYMAPEVFSGKGSTYASDMYALAAIFGELFGAKNILKYKEDAYKKHNLIDDAIYPPYCFDGLFEGYDITGIDPFLLEDFKTLLKQLESEKPKSRPTIHELNKFLITFPGRLDAYEVFNATWKKMEGLFKQFELYHQQLSVLKTKHTLKQFGKNTFSGEPIPSNLFCTEMIKKREAIYKALSKLPLPKSHVSLAKQLIKENRLVDLSGEDNPYPNLEPVMDMLEDENLKLQQALSGIDRFTQAFIVGKKFANTNSTGVIKIINVLRSQATAIDKLKQLQQIGAQKTEKGFSYYFSHSCFFGNGRHKNVEELYQKLARINPEHHLNKEVYLAQTQLNEITDFIVNTPTFTF